MLQFDENGYLTPYGPIESNLETLEEVFAQSQHRQKLFEEYLSFVETLKSLELGSFFQWVNGSFVTRKPVPKDIDVVTFVDYRNFPEKEAVLKQSLFKTKILDCYFTIFYPEKHPLHNLFKMDKAEWLYLYATTRRNIKTGKMGNKGFIQLNF